jgi:hypothetical protein
MVPEPRTIQFWSRSATKFARNSPKPLRGRRTPHRGALERVSRSEHGEPRGAKLWPEHSHPTSWDAPWAISIAVGSDSALWHFCAVARVGSAGPVRERRGGLSKPSGPRRRQNGIGPTATARMMMTARLGSSGAAGGRRGRAAAKSPDFAHLN